MCCEEKQTRYVVVDLNAFDIGLNKFIEPDDHVVLVHALVSDMAGNSRLAKHLTKFPEWYRNNAHKISVAKEWVDIVESERSWQDRTIGLAWRHDRYSHFLRRSIRKGTDHWRTYMKSFEATPERQRFEQARNAFVSFCEEFAEWLEEHEPDSAKRSDAIERASKAIQKPIWGSVWPRKFDIDRKYDSKNWCRELNRFPDRKAFGRISRIICWYGMMLAAGLTHRFENNFEDSAYAFASSYTCWLATDDARLQTMVQTIFPQTRILTKDGTILQGSV